MKLEGLVFTFALLTAAVQVRAGDLSVLGNMNVASNLAPASITLGGQTRTSWPSPAGSGGAIQFNQGGNFGANQDFTWDAGNGLQVTIPPSGAGDKAFRVYCQRPNSGNDVFGVYDANGDERWVFGMLPGGSLRLFSTVADQEVLAFNSSGMEVFTEDNYNKSVSVYGSAWFRNDVELDGKLTASGGMDPPYLLLDSETRASIARRVAREVPPTKRGGAALFWNNQTKKLEIYVAAEGAFYNLAGNVITNIMPPTVAGAVVNRRLTIDADTGVIVTNESLGVPRWQLKSGYKFDRVTGQFTYQASSNAPPVKVTREEAIELR
jgi:hypothetical protein